MNIRSLGVAVLVALSTIAGPAPALALSSSPSSCERPASGHATCFVQIWAKATATKSQTTPPGYSPVQLRAAYGAGTTTTAKLAIVDAYDDPNVASDLNVYSRQFGLPVLPACSSTAQRSCFEKLSQTGSHSYPAANAGWAVETALDTEAAHAMCPGCRLELIEAKSDALTNLLAGVNEAVATGASVVSMSWGGAETSTEVANDSHFKHAGVIFMASAGDDGYGVSWPAASPQVVAVGGTHLKLTAAGARSAAETTWSGTGSGCSRYETKPSWQTDPGCGRRTVADLAADADPATGAAVYTSLSSSGAGWFEVGGTSLAAPLMAGLAADTGATSQTSLMTKLYGSLGTTRLHDVTSGSNGTCSPGYLCKATSGYDGPTGVGAPAGLSAL